MLTGCLRSVLASCSEFCESVATAPAVAAWLSIGTVREHRCQPSFRYDEYDIIKMPLSGIGKYDYTHSQN